MSPFLSNSQRRSRQGVCERCERSRAERQPPMNSYVFYAGKSWLLMIFIRLLTCHRDKTWSRSRPLTGWTQQTSKVTKSGPKVQVEIDASAYG